jgi:hypothetical protein
MTVIILLPIGVPDQKPEPMGRKNLEELFHLDQYGRPLKA